MWRQRLVAISLVMIVCAGVGYIAPVSRAAAVGQTVNISGYPAPGNALTVHGAGFPFGDTVQVLYDTTVVASTFVRGLGGPIGTELITQFTVPLNTTTGTHTITASDQAAGLSAQTTVLVKANWSQYGFRPSGKRYNRYETAVSPTNVSQLALDWTYSNAFLANSDGNAITVADGSLYVAGLGVLIALDPATGTVRWTASDFRVGSVGPAEADNVLYTSGYGLLAWNATTGQPLWSGISQYIFNTAPTLANGLVYATTANVLDAFAADGCRQIECSPVWTFNAGQTNTVGAPAVVNGVAYVTGGAYGDPGYLFAVNANTGAPLWSATLPTDNYPNAPVVDGGNVFVNASTDSYAVGTLFAFNAAGCGKSTCAPLWTASDDATTYDSPAAANGIVYVGANNGLLYAFNEIGCGKSTCAPLWTVSTNGQIFAAPAIANGVVYLGSGDGAMYAFPAAGCGSSPCPSLWRYNVGGRVDSDPSIVNGILYFLSYYDGKLYAFHLPGSSAVPQSSRVRSGAGTG